MSSVTTKQFKQLTSAYAVRDKSGGASTTVKTGSPVAAGDGTVEVTSITGIADGDVLRLGAGEQMELVTVNGTPSGTTVTLTENAVYAHAAGDAVVEQEAHDLGDLSGDLTVRYTEESQDQAVSTKRLVYAVLHGYLDQEASLTLPNVSIYNWATCLQTLLSRIGGAGSAASPHVFQTDGTEVGEEINLSLVAFGVLKDGTIWRIELWGVDVDYTGLNVTLNLGQPATMPIKLTASAGGIVSTVSDPYTALTTYRPTKAKVFDRVNEVGLLVDTATTCALAADEAAGQTAWTVDDETGFAADDWVKVESGDVAEYHQLASTGVATLTSKTPLYRGHLTGAVITLVTPTPLSGLSTDGVQLQIGGSVQKVRVGTLKQTVGLRQGAVTIGARLSLTAFTLAQLAYALQVAQSQIAANRLPINTNVADGAAAIDGFYILGQLAGGAAAGEKYYQRITLWGCSQVLSDFQIGYNNAGNPPAYPFAVRPASGIQIQEWSA